MSRDFAGEAEDRLLEAADDAKVRVPDEGIDVVLRRVVGEGPAEPRNPTEAFFASLTSGRVQKALYLCDHANHTTDRILVRARGAWLLGDNLCISRQLAIRGEDARCDWCGTFVTEPMPPQILKMKTVTVVAKLCPRHRELVREENE